MKEQTFKEWIDERPKQKEIWLNAVWEARRDAIMEALTGRYGRLMPRQ